MKMIFLLLVLLFVWGGVPSRSYAQGYDYPPAKKMNVIDTYFGKEVVDPYRWMENPEDKELLDWLKAQEELTSSVLKGINGRELIVQDLKRILQKRLESEIAYPIGKHGDTWYFEKQTPGDQVYKVYRKTGDGEDELLFDPMNFVKDSVYDLSWPSLNVDGGLMLLNLGKQGNEITDIHILDLKTKKILPNPIRFSSGSFSRTNPRIFYYIQYGSNDVFSMEDRLNWQIRKHIVGTDPVHDKVVVSKEMNTELGSTMKEGIFINTFPYSKYALLELGLPAARDIFYASVSIIEGSENVYWSRFCTKEDEILKAIFRNNRAYCNTTKGNEKGKIISVNIESPDFNKGELIYEPVDGWKIEDISESKDFLLITLNKNILEWKCIKYRFDSRVLSELDLPLNGTILPRAVSDSSNELAVLNATWTRFTEFYDYDLENDKLSKGVLHRSLLLEGMGNLVSETLEVPSHDGTMVPLSLIYNSKLMKKDGSNICLLEGYGSYGMGIHSHFQPLSLSLLNRGVVIAFAHVRGGNEKGVNWHLDGRKINKPNTWKDFNACAEYLIENRYTSANKMGCEGASAGGILIGRAITERPDLYKVAIPLVGAMNALRLEFTPNGPANSTEFGTVADSLEFHALLEMDAMHHVKQGVNYPAQLITTGFNDRRIVAWMPAKYAAMMQAANKGSSPVLLNVQYESGHFGGSTFDEWIEEEVNIQSFLLWQCGHPDFQNDNVIANQ